MARHSKEEIAFTVAGRDREALLSIAREDTQRVLRYLAARLSSDDDEEKRRAVESIGWILANQAIVDSPKATELLRRLVWSLNDESGAVPYGIPEAIGEILAVRPEFREAFLPILFSLLTEDDMIQTGPIERGALWAVGRLAEAGVYPSAEVVSAVRRIAESLVDEATIRTARGTLERVACAFPRVDK